MVLPENINEATDDDIQGSDIDLDSLKEKYIKPIDAQRSLRAAAPLSGNAESVFDISGRARIAQNARLSAPFNPREQQESRAHAFYRLLGLPVISQDFDFYSPGWGAGVLGEKEQQRRARVGSRVSSEMKFSQHLREEEARRRLEIFKKQSTLNAVYCIALGAPNGTRPFQTLDEFKTFYQKDDQIFTQEKRQRFVTQNYKSTNDTALSELWPAFSLLTSNHRLRPFTVDPTIESAADGGTKKVCVPFLKNKEATRWEGSKFLKRPGIELILRLRLKQQNEIQRLKEAVFFLEPKTSFDLLRITPENSRSLDNAGVTLTDLRSIINAAAGEIGAVNDEEITNLLKSSTAFELIQITKFVRLIKALVHELSGALDTIVEVSKEISWVPFAGELGPENGSNLNFTYVTTNVFRPLERQIRKTKLRKANAERQDPITERDDISREDFVLNSYEQTETSYDDDLSELEERRNDLIRRGSEALRTIELITGDVSGLGLIDILSVYTALWAIDLKYVISLIDDSSFTRLWENNKDLRLGAAQDRRDGSLTDDSGASITIIEAMQKFEDQVKNILAFADKIFDQERGVPDEEEGGTIPRE